jgi:hypothetical protein
MLSLYLIYFVINEDFFLLHHDKDCRNYNNYTLYTIHNYIFKMIGFAIIGKFLLNKIILALIIPRIKRIKIIMILI